MAGQVGGPPAAGAVGEHGDAAGEAVRVAGGAPVALAVAGVATGERSTALLGAGGPGGLAVARWVAHAAAVVDATGE